MLGIMHSHLPSAVALKAANDVMCILRILLFYYSGDENAFYYSAAVIVNVECMHS